MKLLTMPNELSHASKYGDGLIVGLKHLSWFVPLEVSIDELRELVSKVKSAGQEIFVSLNKLMYNEDIPLLKEYLLVIEELKVNGILYDDLAVLNLSKSLSLKTPLVWFGPHLFTNYHTANYWYDKGVKYGVLSTEVPIDHIKEIKSNTSMSLMMYGYGHLPMFVSSRSLLSSYFEHIKGSKEDKVYYMYEDARKQSYPTFENGNDTLILSSNVINTIDELPTLNEMIDYLILSSLNISDANFDKICGHYKKALSCLDDKLKLSTISKDVKDDSLVETDKGFLYKETVYRVKSDGER